MIFKIDSGRDNLIGYRIEVQVNAEAGEEIASVSTSYENSSLADDFLSPHEVQFNRLFTQVGGYTPNVERTVTVTATNNSGKQQTASRRWQD